MSYYAWSAAINCVFVILLAVYVLITNPKSKLNQIYALGNFSISLWFFFYFLWQISLSPDRSFLYLKMLMVGCVFIPVFFLHFGIVYTRNEKTLALLIPIIYLLGFIFLLLDLSNQMFDSLRQILFFRSWPIAKYGFTLYAIAFFSEIILTVLLFYRHYINELGIEKERAKYLLIGISIAALSGSPNFILWYGIPIPPFLNIFISVYTLIIAYAITKHRLMDINVIIRKGLIYSILTAIITAIYFSFVFLLGVVLKDIYNSVLWISLPLIFALALLFQPLKNKIQSKVDSWFFPEKQAFRKEINALSNAITGILDLETIKSELTNTMSVLNITNISISTDPNEKIPSSDNLLSIPLKFKGASIGSLTFGHKKSQEPYSDDEIAILNTLANQIAVSINNAKLHKELLEKQKELLLADKFASLGRVATGLAHEIRNPLTAIKGLSQSLAKNIDDKEYVSEFSDIVPKEIDRLNNLVEELVLLSRDTKLCLSPMDINAVLQNTFRLYESFCAKQGIDISVELRSTKKINGDKERLTQVVTNLILNAVHAMPEGGKLSIFSEDTENGIRVRVSDSGEGIPESAKRDLFEPFFSTKQKGAGLGLAIANKIVLDHGGKISVTSTVGKGTEFLIEFPSA